MKKIVWTFGLIWGAMLAAMMLLSTLFIDQIGFDRGEILGYTTMIASSLMVYFGVRAYRDQVVGGAIKFSKALWTGTLMMLIASACYVVTWEYVYFNMMPDFGDKYAAQSIAKAKASGASAEALAEQARDMERFKRLYQNVFFNAAITFLEPLPVGLLAVLVSAGVLSRKRRAPT